MAEESKKIRRTCCFFERVINNKKICDIGSQNCASILVRIYQTTDNCAKYVLR